MYCMTQDNFIVCNADNHLLMARSKLAKLAS